MKKTGKSFENFRNVRQNRTAYTVGITPRLMRVLAVYHLSKCIQYLKLLLDLINLKD